MTARPPRGAGAGPKPGQRVPSPIRRRQAFFSLREATPEGLATPGTGWHLRRRAHLDEYRRRLRHFHGALDVQPSAPPAGARRRLRFASPAIPGLANWVPLGPSVVLNGQAATRPPVSGRVTGVAVSADGQRVYAGSANGGVWRSDDAGRTWYPLMNAFDLQPTVTKSDSLSVGALAIHPEHPDRVYVGSGEGAISDAYFGVGPIVSDDGGLNWRTERWDAGTGGPWFFALAVDPADPERVIGATSVGLIRRQPRNAEQFPGNSSPPQDYLLRYGPSTGAWDLGYWSAEGHTVFDVQRGGAQDWRQWLVFMPFTLGGVPHFLGYEAEKSLWHPLQNQGQYRVFSLGPDGAPQQLHQGAWEFGLLLLPVELGGTSAFVRYNPASGRATLSAWDANAHFTDLWANRQWDTGWSQLMPFTLQGVPHFLAYSAGGVVSSSQAMLYRWSATGEAVTAVWPQKKHLGKGRQLTPFELDGVPCFQAYESSSGKTQVYRWEPDGEFTPLHAREETLDTGLEFTPFLFRGESRLLGYHSGTGRTSVFRWTARASRELLWTGRWTPGRRFMPIQMGYEWRNVTAGAVPAPSSAWATSVVAARQGDSTVFYAAFWFGSVHRSTDGGVTWQPLGGNMPIGTPLGTATQGRVTLAVQPTHPDVVYAQRNDGAVLRFPAPTGVPLWTHVTGEPAGYVGESGNYDLTLAVSPDNVNTLYLGGSATLFPAGPHGHWSGSIYRAQVNPAVPNLAYAFLGASAHPDIHGFTFTPGQPNALWVASDGGVFFTPDPQRNSGLEHVFQSLNAGLSTLSTNKLGQHPTRDAILFASNQDNGCPRYTGNEAWSLPDSMFGDSGCVVVDPDPANNGQNILATYKDNVLFRSQDGGGSYTQVAGPGTAQLPLMPPDSVEFYAPLVSAGPVPLLMNRVAFGTQCPWLSDDFGTNWAPLQYPLGVPQQTPQGTPDTGFNITALAFSANGQTLFAGLGNGQVYSYTEAAGIWGAPVNLNAPAAFTVPVTSITMDPANAGSFYVTFGGNLPPPAAGWQRVWYYDGGTNTWAHRSGPAAGNPASLMDIQFNTLVARQTAGGVHLYAGADLGVWHSADAGQHWSPFGVGLPESAVLDLKLFEAAPPTPIPALLRASTHGRGVYEFVLDNDARFRAPVQLYLRRTLLDRGLYRVQDGWPDPTDPAQRPVNHRDGVDLKLMLPTGGQDSDTFPARADVSFATFAALQDQSQALARQTRTRLYIQVHNRGVMPADGVRLVVLLSSFLGAVPAPPNPAPNPPRLPNNFKDSITQGFFLRGGAWTTHAILALDDLHAGTPEVRSLDFPRDTFQQAGLYCLLVVAHCPRDPFTSNEQDVDALTVADRLVAMKYLTVV